MVRKRDFRSFQRARRRTSYQNVCNTLGKQALDARGESRFTPITQMPNLLQLQPSSVPTHTILPILINHPPDENPSELQFPREEIQNLRKEYEFQLEARSAQEQDVCPIRTAINSELFEELIRQAFLEQNELGILLARVRDEARMTASNYQTMYEYTLHQTQASIDEAEDGLADLRVRRDQLEQENKDLKLELQVVQTRLKTVDINERSRDQVIKRFEHADEVSYYKKQIEYYQQVVQRITQQVDEMTVKMFGEKKTQAKKPQAENQDEAAAEAAE